MKTDIKKVSRRTKKVEKDLDQIFDSKIDVPPPTIDPTDLSYLLNFHSD
ncbi:hypothetical protein TVAG_417790 [Trichomonas vaginalis G3]|uniref:Uncharacterized protein n=1 Tax=Trichomonas vaginalis (strain ATCC PRA-98 / G3) TaxID=412133 RepID=A2ED99_TRIV3|nr:hypothetical protein TVAGG3_0876210 [Trichomonas vaginalis G3]EAY09357.1 hypothetical protein TVAG_417790 [Trichomonas vaginalis G3]KAI5501707.1 hypothetical protein TVAGG3_0876210 [Trichomonas vaginalis G3]|eukprot:XP_001321580.1 hypothetical protein [Trichomonas vaginalis G3]